MRITDLRFGMANYPMAERFLKKMNNNILRLKRAWIGISALLLCTITQAATVDFDIQPRVLRVGEGATLSLTIRGANSPAPPRLPRIEGFSVSQPSTQQSMTFVNGKLDRSLTYQYHLISLKPGNFTVGPFNYPVQGTQIQLPAILLKVADSGHPAGTGGQDKSERLFARLSTDRTNVYNQEIFDIKLAIYYRDINLGRDASLLNLPESGLSMQQFEEIRASRQLVNSQIYQVRNLRLKVRALTEGTFELKPSVRLNMLIQSKSRRSRSFFDDFFQRTQSQPVEVQTEPLTVNVLPLPEKNRPPHFYGAVGTFQFKAEVKPTEISVGDPITLSMEVRGQGNIESISTPEINFGDQFKVYEPKLVSRDLNKDRSAGRKVFEQVVIPKTDQLSEFPPIEFSYFDPKNETYKNITFGPYPLTVNPAENGLTRVVQGISDTSPRTAKIIGMDIAYLKPAPVHWFYKYEKPWVSRKSFWAIQCLPGLALVSLFFIMRRREDLTRDTAKARRQQAPKVARLAFQKAEEALNKANRPSFHEAVWEMIGLYFGNRLNLAPGEVPSETVLTVLKQGGLDQESVAILKNTFELCEQYRFGRGNRYAQALSENEKNEFKEQLDQLIMILKTCNKIKI
ncbi:MAG: hypothetical protein GKR87_00925 [Kiritimatiellae bacterium]|nr:hypothetical protein [Kiritimatiellia bacterium]